MKDVLPDPDLVIGADGRLYANAARLPLALRQGRRVIRCVALTPGEEAEARRRIASLGGELLAGLVGKPRR